MKITINGQDHELNHLRNLDKLIAHVCKKPKHVIAELNGEIIKSLHWPETTVKDGDQLELVTLVGGG